MADTSDGGVCIGVCDTMNVALNIKVIVFFERLRWLGTAWWRGKGFTLAQTETWAKAITLF